MSKIFFIITLTGFVVYGVMNCGKVETEQTIYSPNQTVDFQTFESQPQYYIVSFDGAIYNCVLNNGDFEGHLWVGSDNRSHGENITITTENRGVVGETPFKIKNGKIEIKNSFYNFSIEKE